MIHYSGAIRNPAILRASCHPDCHFPVSDPSSTPFRSFKALANLGRMIDKSILRMMWGVYVFTGTCISKHHTAVQQTHQ